MSFARDGSYRVIFEPSTAQPKQIKDAAPEILDFVRRVAAIDWEGNGFLRTSTLAIRVEEAKALLAKLEIEQ